MPTLPTALYIHLPWCLTKCPYCDFHSLPASIFPEEAYTKALIEDLKAAVAQHGPKPLLSIFFGGGTPSLFSPASLGFLIDAIHRYFPLTTYCEITLEANPGTFEQHKWQDFYQAGINRLSIGVQSFNDDCLKKLGRIHSGQEAKNAIAKALAIFPEVNIDLMYGLPGQSVSDFRKDLQTALAFSTPHISYYQLTLEPQTIFGKNPPKLPFDDHIATMEEMLWQSMEEAGYEHYEISNYAQKGHYCQHNCNYWTFGDYFGIGAGAHGKITSDHGVCREERIKNPKNYITQEKKIAECLYPQGKDLVFEFMLNALRLKEGVPLAFFQERTGIPFSTLDAPIKKAQDLGLLIQHNDRIQPTPKGFLFLNDLLGLFSPA
jgi:oxygen-independent coproporphyrinogen-3 oxidase